MQTNKKYRVTLDSIKSVKKNIRIKYVLYKQTLYTFFNKYYGKILRKLTKENEEQYQRMIAEVEDYAIIMLDTKGIIQNWNIGAEKIKGYKETEIVGQSFERFYLQEDRERKLPEILIQEALVSGRATHEGWRLRNDGTKFWGSIVITAIHNATKQVIGFSKVTRDLTERKFAEDKLLEYSRELEIQNKELKQFAYIASHDMKEPLRKILLYNSLLRDSLDIHLSENDKKYFGRTVNAANRMQTLIEDLLTYSATTFFPDTFTSVDLNLIAKEVADYHSDSIEGIEGEIIISRLPVITGIEFQIRQLFDNLISNSIKYRSEERKLKIEISCSLVNEVLFNKEHESTYYCLEIRDNGLGFGEQYAEKIFELFQRLVNKNEFNGNGIGLTICKKIVRNHGGIIKAEGIENKAAIFKIYLPVTIKS